MNIVKQALLDELSNRYGSLRKLENSQSLYEIGNGAARIYIRYSKVHNRGRTFYGLREEDLRKLEGFPSVLSFLWDSQSEPLFIPFSEYEEIFRSLTPASDGQFKVQIYSEMLGTSFILQMRAGSILRPIMVGTNLVW